MFTKPLLTLLLAAGALSFSAPAASAQELSLQLSRRIGNGHVGVSFNSGRSRGSIRFGGNTYGGHVRPSYSSARTWVAGHHAWVDQQVWVPARTERVWVDAVYRVVYEPCGTAHKVLVREGHYADRHHPGHYEVKRVRVWQPGHWSYSAGPRPVIWRR